MQVTCMAEWQTYASNRQGTMQALDDNDGRELLGEEKWNALSWVERHHYLEQRADLLVLAYMRKNDAISQEFFEKRVAEIKG